MNDLQTKIGIWTLSLKVFDKNFLNKKKESNSPIVLGMKTEISNKKLMIYFQNYKENLLSLKV